MTNKETQNQFEKQQKGIAKLTKDLADKAEAARLRAPTAEERNVSAIRGLKRMAGSFLRTGEKTKADSIVKFAEQAQTALDQMADIEEQFNKKVVDPLQVAVDAAAKSLIKNLPGCFADHADAVIFAGNLPFTAARKESVYAADRKQKLSRERSLASRKFWKAVSSGAVLATNKHSNDAVQLVVAAGLE